ncbi:hypothetical protein [Paraburkholderia graminis]
MNIYHWITLIAALDIILVLLVRGADERRKDRKRETEWRRA